MGLNSLNNKDSLELKCANFRDPKFSTKKITQMESKFTMTMYCSYMYVNQMLWAENVISVLIEEPSVSYLKTIFSISRPMAHNTMVLIMLKGASGSKDCCVPAHSPGRCL